MTDLSQEQEAKLATIMVDGGVLGELEAVIREAAATFLEAGATDLNTFATRLSAQLLFAEATDDQELRDSVARQARMLAEVQRLRFSDAAWSTFYSVVEQSTRIAVNVATNILLAGAAKIA
tara:strand:- start:2739 stop:3101 length:363 start_codon:yes stop_codon:yes gene_type:complete